MSHTFISPWWSIELPENWNGYRDDVCVTFSAEPALGALQISAHKKEGTGITDGDLKDFAQECVDSGAKLGNVQYGPLSGYYTHYAADDIYWKHWWLGSGRSLVYVTYNVALDAKGIEDVVIDEMLATLQLRES